MTLTAKTRQPRRFNGFQSQYSWYTTLLNSVVSNGYISVAYQVPGMMSVATEMETRVNPVLQWITSGSLQAVLPSTIRANTSSIFAAGHSRGGKVASLTYTSHSEVVNAVLVDPVDSSVFSPISADNPSAVEALRASGKTISVVGAGVTGSCNPAQGNYAQFYDAGAAGSWELVIAEAGHAQFLDAGGLMNRIQDTLCGSGSESRAEVADLVAADMVAWFSGNAGTRASFIDTVRQEEGVQFRVKG